MHLQRVVGELPGSKGCHTVGTVIILPINSTSNDHVFITAFSHRIVQASGLVFLGRTTVSIHCTLPQEAHKDTDCSGPIILSCTRSFAIPSIVVCFQRAETQSTYRSSTTIQLDRTKQVHAAHIMVMHAVVTPTEQ